MSPSRLTLSLVLGATLALACDDTRAPSGPSVTVAPLGTLSVQVPTLTLPLMTDACFRVKVYRTSDPAELAPGNVVVSQDHLCTSERGAAGYALDLLTVCDPAAPGPGAVNTVELELEDLYMRGPAATGVVLTPDYYINPCPPGAGSCVLTAPCGGASVSFGLSLVAHPGLGVVETSVSLGEVFCSAMLECAPPSPGGRVDPYTGVAGPTAAMGLSCRGGDGALETFLYRDDLIVTCEVNGQVTRSAVVDPTASPGEVTLEDAGGVVSPLYSVAIHRGLANDGVSTYWNLVLGLRPASATLGETCTLAARAATSDEALSQGVTPEHARFPIIHWRADLFTHDGVTGALACAKHPLGGADGVVATSYTELTAQTQLLHQLARGPDGHEVTTTFAPFVFGPVYADETVAFMDALGIANDATVYYAGTPQEISGAGLWGAVDGLVTGLKAQGLWDRIRALYPFVGGTPTRHRVNLRDPRDLDAAYRLTFFGGTTHSATGYKPNGTTGYADTHLSNASLPQDSVSMATYNREAGNNGFEISGSAAPRTQLIAKYTNGSTFFDTNNTFNLSQYTSTKSGLGFYLSSRVSPSTAKLFIDGVLDRTLNAASSAPQDKTFKLSKWQDGSIYSSRQLAFAMIAEGLSDAEAPALDALVEAFQVALHRSVR